MTGLFRQWMVEAFSDPENLEDPDLKHLRWDPDPQKAGLTIESATAWEPRLTGSRPAVVIRRHGWKRIKLGIGDNLTFGTTLPDGTVARGNWWRGAHTLFCVGGTGGEAELLGTAVYREINQFAMDVLRRLDLKQLEVVEVGEAGILEEAGDSTFVVPVTVAYVVEEVWRAVRGRTRLAAVDLAIVFK
jgi:hypothetical protein